jgi:hypothetical protein
VANSDQRKSQYSIQIECPDCSQKMIVRVGVRGDPEINKIKCVGCQSGLTPPIPGSIVAGPVVD